MMNNNNTVSAMDKMIIDGNSVITGKIKNMRLDQVIKNFTDLLISNDPREDKDMYIGKNDFYSRTIWRILRNSDCNKMTISDCHGNVLSMTSDIDIMFMILAYYEAWIEDSVSNESGIGFCWRTEDDEWYSAVFA